MASAPKPGQVDREFAKTNRKPHSRIAITLCGTKLEMDMPRPFKELAVVRMATGLPLSAFWGGEYSIDEQSVQVMWWLARRANGEPRLDLERVLDEWPDRLTPDDIEVEEITDDDDVVDDDPEG